MTVHHYWYAPGNGAPDETTYDGADLGSGAYAAGRGSSIGATQQNLASEGHWYGFRSAGIVWRGRHRCPYADAERFDGREDPAHRDAT